jgi:hypothetical protein
MNNPLVKLFEECEQTYKNHNNDGIQYDLIEGLWKTSNGDHLINNLINSNITAAFETIKTATREGIDQSESSVSQVSTTITKTRESIDQSESVNSHYFSTMITETREAVDQSENS